ncbi:MAG: hypothetical protein RL367_2843 [Pseudomonadota bacterium]
MAVRIWPALATGFGLASAAMAQPPVPSPVPTATIANPAAVPSKIDAAVFAAIPQLGSPRLSPDGTKLAGRVFSGGKERLGILTIANHALQTIGIGEKNEMVSCRWAGPNRLLISLGQSVKWFGEESYATRLLVYDLTTRQSLFIGKKEEGLEGDDILYVDPDGQFILMQFQRTIYDYPSVYRVELGTNKMTEIVKQRDSVWEWYADSNGTVRIGTGFIGEKWFLLYRRTADEKFVKTGKVRVDDEKASLELFRPTHDSDLGYVLSNEKTGRYALYRYNYATREMGELVYESPTNDVDDYDLSDIGGTLESVSLAEERDKIVWFNPDLKKLQAKLDRAIKGQEVWMTDRTRDKKHMLVWSGASNNPGSYYLYEPDAARMALLFDINPGLVPEQMPQARYIKYSARDGTEIPAYLTLPLGRAEKNLPLVILPHGGPYDIRDKPDYDDEVQFLANRGYAVLQPNYRGSGGYGKAFYEKGEGQWGRAMQDDLDDGMDWLVKQGIADPKRVCLVGSSYGGYAALWGVTRNPERYRCAASFAGVTDLKKQLRYQTTFMISRRYRKDWRTTIKGQEKVDLDTLSPLKFADRLNRPVLLGHGDDDQRVPYKQSSEYAAALKKAGKPYEFQTYKGEGHGFSKVEDNIDWLKRLEAFLIKYNPA